MCKVNGLTHFDNFVSFFAALPADFDESIRFNISSQINSNKKVHHCVKRSQSYFLPFNGTDLAIPQQPLENINELEIAKVSAPVSFAATISPTECCILYERTGDKAISAGRKNHVAALDLPQPSLLVWVLFHNSTTYYVFGKRYDEGYRYITYQKYEKPFIFEANNDPNKIDLTGKITDRRVFYIDSDHKLVVACCADQTHASYDAKTDEVYAFRTGESWFVDLLR